MEDNKCSRQSSMAVRAKNIDEVQWYVFDRLLSKGTWEMPITLAIKWMDTQNFNWKIGAK